MLKHNKIFCMAGKLRPCSKMIMNAKLAIAFIVFIMTAACNNNASDRNEGDSSAQHIDSTDHGNWPKPHDITGGDSVPSPETQADTSR